MFKYVLFSAFLALATPLIMAQDIIDEVYAVVNGEAITRSELQKAEFAQMRELQGQLKGEELTKAIEKMRAELLNTLIDAKLISSLAKDKKYNVDQEVDSIIQEIKKNNNISSDDDLKKALQTEGMSYDFWRKQLRDSQIQNHFIQEEIGSRIKVGNPDIAEFYRKNIAKFTTAPELTLNAIFLKKEGTTPEKLKEKMEQISVTIKPENFKELAQTHSDIGEGADKGLLGKFKQGEMQKELEGPALQLKKDEISTWIETESGWYLIQLVEFTAAKVSEYKEVSDNIQQMLYQEKRQVKLQEYLKELRKTSYIKILRQY